MIATADIEYRLLEVSEQEELELMQRALAAIATVASELKLVLPREETAVVADSNVEFLETAVDKDDGEEILAAKRGRRGMWGAEGGRDNSNKSDDDMDDDSSDDDEDGQSGASFGIVGGSKIGSEGGFGSGLLGACEIAWQGKIERTVFPLPMEFKYLTPKTKKDFMEGVPLDTADIRMTELIKQSPVLEAEMKLVHEKSVESWYYQFLTNYLSEIKGIM